MQTLTCTGWTSKPHPPKRLSPVGWSYRYISYRKRPDEAVYGGALNNCLLYPIYLQYLINLANYATNLVNILFIPDLFISFQFTYSLSDSFSHELNHPLIRLLTYYSIMYCFNHYSFITCSSIDCLLLLFMHSLISFISLMFHGSFIQLLSIHCSFIYKLSISLLSIQAIIYS